jgi:gluconolactonase
MSTGISRALLRSLPLAIALFGVAQAGEPKTIKGLKNPESAAVGPDGKVYVTVIGEREKKGDGSVAIVEPSGKITMFATGLDDPHGVVIVADSLYIADVKVVWKVDAKGKVEVYLGPEGFPRAPGYLNDIAHDGKGKFQKNYVQLLRSLVGISCLISRRVRLKTRAKLSRPRQVIQTRLLTS